MMVKSGLEFFILKFSGLPSSIYSWSIIGHILEHEFLCLGRLGSSGSKEKKVHLSYSEQLLRVFFFNFLWAKKNLNILATALKSCIKSFYKVNTYL